MTTNKQIDQCLAALAVVYPQHFKNQADPDLARRVYHQIWSDLDADLLEAATKQWLSTARPFHPSPGELRDLALRLVSRDEPAPDEAWSEVFDAVRRIGSYGTPKWSHERIAKTMQAFGRWSDFCLMETDQVSIVRAQFIKIYEAQTQRQRDERLMLPETKAKVDVLIGQTAKRLTGGHS